MTLQNGSIELTGRPTLRVVLRLPPETLAALNELGHEDPPRDVSLLLREATGREQQWYEQQIKATSQRPDQIQAQAEFVALILRKRCEHVPDDVVLLELARDMTETSIAQFTQAFLSGRLDDPKVLAGAIRQTRHNMAQMLYSAMALADLSPSSPPSMASDPGNATSSPEAS